MHLYAKLDQNIPCGSRVMSILQTAKGRTDSHSDYSADPRVVRFNAFNYQLWVDRIHVHCMPRVSQYGKTGKDFVLSSPILLPVNPLTSTWDLIFIAE